jgi:thymidylate synthase ThyX
MTHSAKILADSISPGGVRLTTMEVVMPRIILAEFNTHRMFSRNSASSRAIPVEKMIKMVQENPYIPSAWPKNQKGMSASENVADENTDRCVGRWVKARNAAVEHAQQLLEYGVHKQIANRLLEPFLWHTVIVTATEWSNFFHLRDNPQAHPEIQKVAELMRDALAASTPIELKYGEWHVPLIHEEDVAASSVLAAVLVGRTDGMDGDGWHEHRWQRLCKISVARCARVSYLTHGGKRDIEADIRLHDELLKNGHLSPFEHVARPAEYTDFQRNRQEADDVVLGERVRYAPEMEVVDAGDGPYARLAPEHQWHGNFRGWVQYRKTQHVVGAKNLFAPLLYWVLERPGPTAESAVEGRAVKVVYIAGPFSAPTAWAVEQNVRKAEEAGLWVAEHGAMPLIPHANTRFFHGLCTPEFWYAGTMELLKASDGILLLDGWEKSDGAFREAEEAERRGMQAWLYPIVKAEGKEFQKWAKSPMDPQPRSTSSGPEARCRRCGRRFRVS